VAQAGLPRPLERGELRPLLASCDRRTAVGRRDFAMLLLMGRLGLSCGELAGLMLGDIDWRAGELTGYCKGRRDDRLPRPVDVGRALAAYLRRGRPGGALEPDGVRANAGFASAADRGRGQPRRALRGRARRLRPLSAHRLRHTAATELLRAGASLPEVVRCSATAARSSPRSTPRSTRARCAAWPARGRRPVMSPLRQPLDDYLQIRRALGSS
jgi:integrase/recombinase XerD